MREITNDMPYKKITKSNDVMTKNVEEYSQ